jgi:hypothetical protein
MMLGYIWYVNRLKIIRVKYEKTSFGTIINKFFIKNSFRRFHFRENAQLFKFIAFPFRFFLYYVEFVSKLIDGASGGDIRGGLACPLA